MTRSTFSWTLPPGPPLTEAQRALVTEALPVVPAVVREVLRVRPAARHRADDLASVAREGLLWAVQRYDAGRGSRWVSYAFWGARIRCLAWIRASQLRDPDVYLDAPASYLGVAALEQADHSVGERIRDHSPGPEELLLRRQVLAAVAALPERERLAVTRYLDESTLAEVGSRVGRTAEMVRKWEVSGLRMLREEFGLEPRRERRTLPPLDAREKLTNALRERPKTAADLRALTGFTRTTVHEHMRQAGAVQVGTVVRNGRAAPLWAIPYEVA